MSKREIIFFMRFKGFSDGELIAKWLYDNLAYSDVNLSFRFNKDLSIAFCEIAFEKLAPAPFNEETMDEYLIKVQVGEFLVGVKTEEGVSLYIQKECPYCLCEPRRVPNYLIERDNQ